jgi:molecular chaperone DnaK
MPVIQQIVQQLIGRAPRQGVNPDEVVALGASVQASVITGELKNVVLLDVTPLSLGVETVGGVFTRLIHRNTTIPVRRSEIFTTGQDNQVGVDVHVLQGERDMSQDNQSLGHFNLEGIQPAPAGVPQVEVTFDIDHNGIVNVSARDLHTGLAQHITITASTNLSPVEVDRLVAEAARAANVDTEKRKEAELRNSVEALIFRSQHVLDSHDEPLSARERAVIEEAVAELRGFLANGDLDAARSSSQRLEVLLPSGISTLTFGRLGAPSSGQSPTRE